MSVGPSFEDSSLDFANMKTLFKGIDLIFILLYQID